MDAKDLRAHGKIAESLNATRRAVDLDSTMAQGRLMIAQLEMELGRPDSALVTMRRALAGGEDSAFVAEFALSKGNSLYRAANTTKTSATTDIVRFATWVRPFWPSRICTASVTPAPPMEPGLVTAAP